MLNLVCVKHGSLYGADYVNKLHAGVIRNLGDDIERKFICFTDDPTGLRAEIEVRLLPEDVRGWWSKLYLFSPRLFPMGERILYFDLDTVFVGPLDEIAKYDGRFAILRDVYRPDGWQSSVMAWQAGFGHKIWESWIEAGRPEIEGGDQLWIERCFGISGALYWAQKPDLWQDILPGAFVSYKQDCSPLPPVGAKVVIFHGDPKPHDCGRPWVAAMWQESDYATFDPVMVANVDLETTRKQSALSGERGIPHIRSQPPHDEIVCLIGGGPSLAESLEEIRARQSDGQKIWALNGTLDWLTERGILPDAMVLLDARADNVKFVQKAPAPTHYYLACQVHPAVYDALEGREVSRFELQKLGNCGTTVGTHAMAVAFVEGFRTFHLFGFDSSYRNGEGHAYKQSLNERENIATVVCGDREYRAAPWMARQAKDFESMAFDFVHVGCEIQVHGDGLLPHAARLLAQSLIPTTHIRGDEVLRRVNGTLNPVGAEIGVFRGGMSRRLLGREDLTLYMVDSWEGKGKSYEGDSGDYHAELSQEEQDECYRSALAQAAHVGSRAKVIRKRSIEAARDISGSSLDFVFIDADHSYEGCRADILAWWSRVKVGGIVAGHDYENTKFPKFGVKRAVDEIALRLGQTVDLGPDFTWFLRRTDVALYPEN